MSSDDFELLVARLALDFNMSTRQAREMAIASGLEILEQVHDEINKIDNHQEET